VRRRHLIAVGGAAILWPFAGRAQQKTIPIIGFLSGTAPVTYAPFLAAFREGLKDQGYVEGQSVTVEYRWAEGVFDRLPALADDLVRRRVDLLVTSGSTLSALAAKKATDTIPTVFTAGDDPVATGLVASLARPGGNRTGISFLVVDLNAKRFELLSDLVPQAKTLALLVNPNYVGAADRIVAQIREAAQRKRVDLIVLNATGAAEIDAAFATLAERHAQAVLIGNDAFFNSERQRMIALAERYAVPASYESHEAVRAGGLISYGPSFLAIYRELGVYAGKVLKGAKPADLPVQQPTKFELAINLKTANALGLTVPPILLSQADEVIE
jgi:putative ABC transport system substrate-binding protein